MFTFRLPSIRRPAAVRNHSARRARNDGYDLVTVSPDSDVSRADRRSQFIHDVSGNGPDIGVLVTFHGKQD